jgi:hypothetical protein
MNLLQMLWELFSQAPLLTVIVFTHSQRTPHKKEWHVKINLPPETLLEIMLNSCTFETFTSETNYLPATMYSAFTSSASGPSCFLEGQMYFESQM